MINIYQIKTIKVDKVKDPLKLDGNSFYNLNIGCDGKDHHAIDDNGIYGGSEKCNCIFKKEDFEQLQCSNCEINIVSMSNNQRLLCMLCYSKLEK